MKSNLRSESATGDLKLKACHSGDGPVAAELSVPDAAACEPRDVESEVNAAAVRESAYYKWQAAGCPCGTTLGSGWRPRRNCGAESDTGSEVETDETRRAT
jgi:hypothetical protein